MLVNKRLAVLPILFVCILCAVGCTTPRAASVPPLVTLPADYKRSKTTQYKNELTRNAVFADSFLVGLIDVAVKQNNDVSIAMQRIVVARSYFRIKKGAMLPSVEAATNASAQKYGDYTMEGVGNFDTNLSGNIDDNQKVQLPIVPNYFLGLRSSWEIDLWGKLSNQKKAAYLRLLGTEQARNLVITTLVAEVSFSYYELLALDEQRAILERNIALQDSAIRIAEIQKEVGRTTALGIQQFQAQLLRTQSLLVQTEQDIARTENELNYLLGRFPQKVERKKAFLVQNMPPLLTAGLPEQILNKRPDVLQAEAELKATKADVMAAKATFLPSLTLTPFVGYNAFNNALLFNPASLAYGIIGGAAAPLLNRSSIKGNYNRLQAEKMEAYYNYNKTVINAFREVQTALSNMDNLRRIYNLNQQEAEVLVQAVSTSGELFKAGYATYLEVIAAQRNALEAEINQVETKKNLFQALITLYRSSGGGWQ